MPAKGQHPFVTIAIPCLNEERFIAASVHGALQQQYPADRLEVLVADGGSSDGTLRILHEIAAQDQRLKIIGNPGRIQSTGMNEILRRAAGDVVVRMDAHCEYASDYVRVSVELLEATGADNVGGAQRPCALASGNSRRARFQQAVCVALASPLAVGGAAYRSATREGFVDTVFCGSFRRRVFETAGLYDPGAVTNEDAELNQRILQNGGRIYLSPRLVAYYYPRDSPAALARQYFRYGAGRARTLVKHRTFPTLRPLGPFLAVTTGAAMLVSGNPLLPFCAGAYALITGAEAIRVARGEGVRTVLAVWGIFPLLHVSHGVGFAVGLARSLRRPDWSEQPERLAPRHVAPAPAHVEGKEVA